MKRVGPRGNESARDVGRELRLQLLPLHARIMKQSQRLLRSTGDPPQFNAWAEAAQERIRCGSEGLEKASSAA